MDIISRARLAVRLLLLLLEVVLHGVHASTGARPLCLMRYFFVCASSGFLLMSRPHIAFQRCGGGVEGKKGGRQPLIDPCSRPSVRGLAACRRADTAKPLPLCLLSPSPD